jgi:hypothetical protein
VFVSYAGGTLANINIEVTGSNDLKIHDANADVNEQVLIALIPAGTKGIVQIERKFAAGIYLEGPGSDTWVGTLGLGG